MSDIEIDIINPVRPYILFEHKEDGFCGYVDTSNMACGVIPVDVLRERYVKHKQEMEEAYAQLQGWIKPLWDKWLAGGNDNREWLINTPIDQLVIEGCPDGTRKIVENLKALAIFYKYSSRKIEGNSYVEMYSYGRKEFTEEEIVYIRRGEQLDISNRRRYFANVLFRIATNDDKAFCSSWR